MRVTMTPKYPASLSDRLRSCGRTDALRADHLVLDMRYRSKEARFCNHVCDIWATAYMKIVANPAGIGRSGHQRMVPIAFLLAKVDIPAAEEITFD